jgi:hypothetical protein
MFRNNPKACRILPNVPDFVPLAEGVRPMRQNLLFQKLQRLSLRLMLRMLRKLNPNLSPATQANAAFLFLRCHLFFV